jgi:beta-lactamase class A
MSLQSDIQAVIQQANIDAGVAIEHIETGEKIDVNGSQSYPMASVFKIPILATAGLQLKEGKIRLDDRVTLKDEDKSAGSGILPYFQAGLNPTVRDLLTLMIIISDNTGTDMSLELLGGPQVIESTMHQLGLTDIYFKLNVKDLLKSLYPPEIADLPLEERRAWLEVNDIVRDGTSFSRGPDNNVSTPIAMTRLVAMLFKGEIVDGEIKDELIDILLKQQFNDRLPRFLPNGTLFAHKTGTIGGVRNDSGVIYVGENNHVAVTLFTWWDDEAVRNQPEAAYQRIFEVETAMGKIGRLVYDHYKA